MKKVPFEYVDCVKCVNLEHQLTEAQEENTLLKQVAANREPWLAGLGRFLFEHRIVRFPDDMLAWRDERDEAQGKLEAAKKQVVGQKGTLHKVTVKWVASKREGERLAAALAHLLAWMQPLASQRVEAEVETAIEELEQYRKAHPRLDRALSKERE